MALTFGIDRGVAFMLAAMVVFAVQDGISRHLAEDAPPIFIVMIRYWAFAAFVLAVSQSRPGGISASARTAHPVAQCARGVMLVAQIVMITASFVLLGLAETHAVMAVHPLIATSLGALVLGERVAGPQWAAVLIGFAGVLVILQPGTGVFDPNALLALVSAALFGSYAVLTRWVGGNDHAGVSFFYTGVAGAVAITLIGPFFWSTLTSDGWIWMGVLCITGAGGHYLLIKAYEAAEAAALQPYAYLQVVLASTIGVFVFGELLRTATLVGAAMVIGAGLFALWYARRVRLAGRAPA